MKTMKNVLLKKIKLFILFFIPRKYKSTDLSDQKDSQPYVIKIVNNSETEIIDVEFLGGYQYINNAGFSAGGDLVIGSVTISSGIPSLSYREMLYQFMNQPYSVGLTYIQSATANQVLEVLSVNTKDANGNTAQKTLVPIIHPYQLQDNIIAMKYPYSIDGFTKIILTKLLPKATVMYYLYLKEITKLGVKINKNLFQKFINWLKKSNN